jgi:hypothetical protein
VVDITVIISYADYHAALLPRAVASVHAQTVPCALITIEDTDRKGPGWGRNQGLAQVVTPYVAFLDADDSLAPNWAEQTLATYRPGQYVYTDWWEGSHVVQAPECPWMVRDTGERTFHTLTALLRTEDAQAVRFNEDLPGAEDTDFYRRLVLGAGVCGIRVPLPLFYYGAEGQRSLALHQNEAMHRLVTSRLDDQWRGVMSTCAKCGGAHAPAIAIQPQGELQPGNVWVYSNWDGNRAFRGLATGNVYARGGNGKIVQVDARDQAVEPNVLVLYDDGRSERRAESVPDAQPARDMERVDVQEFTDLGAMFKALTGASEPPPPAYDPYAGQVVSGVGVRDLSRVMRKLEEVMG